MFSPLIMQRRMLHDRGRYGRPSELETYESTFPTAQDDTNENIHSIVLL